MIMLPYSRIYCHVVRIVSRRFGGIYHLLIHELKSADEEISFSRFSAIIRKIEIRVS